MKKGIHGTTWLAGITTSDSFVVELPNSLIATAPAPGAGLHAHENNYAAIVAATGEQSTGGIDYSNGEQKERKHLLAAFYQERNLTAKAKQVDAIMETNTAEEISASCLEKYGADPFATNSALEIPVALPAFEATDARKVSTSNDPNPVPAPPPPPPTMAPDVAEKRGMLEAFYQKHSPAQVAQVEAIMDAYTVEHIQETCMQKYGADPFEPAPPPPPPPAMAPDVAEKRGMLEAFYQKHSPAQVAQVEAIMDAYTVEHIQETCMQKYGADPFEPAPPPPPPPAI
ncbi:hypothetical protein CYMTET_20348 [Cymbomonas tetramitiformis]|uniref:Uncharacterized protein n=1 Tax=Cymbomonas tetramitiformis TaxID=36881 RepID=A0AAE0L4B3_9CHLO|nr:hypothetical protein CYMTET_20348 [Cymbomonas tetramitiformis]